MDVLPQARQAAGKKTVGLLAGVLADQLQLAQGFGNLALGHGGQSREQLLGAFQTEAIDGDLKIFRRLSHAAMAVSVGRANHAQGQGRTVLHQVGNLAHRAATVAQGPADTVVTGLRNRQGGTREEVDPVFERGRSWRWGGRVFSHVWRRSSSTIPMPGGGQISFSPELAIVWRSFADK